MISDIADTSDTGSGSTVTVTVIEDKARQSSWPPPSSIPSGPNVYAVTV